MSEEFIALIALLCMVMLTATLIYAAPGLFRTVLGADKGRVTSLDGLRGLAALMVVVHHSGIMATFINTGSWDAPSTNMLNQLGSLSVAIFFMISAFLFVGSLIRRNGIVDIKDFARGRALRIAPLYFVGVVLLVTTIFIETGPVLNDEPLSILESILRWCLFGFTKRGEINGFADTDLLYSQVWTLRYEIALYALIPILALAFRIGRSYLVFGIMIAISLYSPMFWFFVAGAAASSYVQLQSRSSMLLLCIGIVGFVVCLFYVHSSNGLFSALLLWPFFVASLTSPVMMCILSWTPLRLLGTVSYSVYLLHSFIIWYITHWLLAPADFAASGNWLRLVMYVFIGMVTISVSIISFIFIERPLFQRRHVSSTEPKQ